MRSWTVRIRLSILAIPLCWLAACASPGSKPTPDAIQKENEAREAIRRDLIAILQEQADAWNRGDLKGFMQHYWRSDQTTFSTGGETLRGWQATMDRYHEKYPTRAQMGRLSFYDIEVEPLSSWYAFVLGRWQLDRPPDSPGGNFTLIFRRLGCCWLIVHDHTSVHTGLESTAGEPP